MSACKSRNIYVIGVEPPFAPEVYEKMVAMPDQYGYLAQITPDASAVFKKYGFEFYDYTDPLSVGITDKDMMDSVHTTERGSFVVLRVDDGKKRGTPAICGPPTP